MISKLRIIYNNVLKLLLEEDNAANKGLAKFGKCWSLNDIKSERKM